MKPAAVPSRVAGRCDDVRPPSSEAAAIDPWARVRHDLRTPASHILGYSEMLLEEAAEAGAERLLPDLRRIGDAGRRLVQMIREELSPERLARAPLDLRHLHSELRTPLNHVVGYSEILFELVEQEDLPQFVPDLQKVHAAAHQFLARMAELLVPARFDPAVTPGTAVASAVQPDALALSREPGGRADSSSSSVGSGLVSGVVLVVDDDPANRELLSRRLTRQGFEVVAAADGRTALELVRQRKVDLVLLDLIMPGMAGDEVLARLKADPAARELPVIMLSALDETDSVVRCLLMGAEDYLAKPFNSVLLRARLSTCLEKRRLRQLEQEHLRTIEAERQKSEVLLLNILPQAIAQRLKDGETTIVDSLPEVSVLFADLVGFTQLTNQLPSSEMVQLLDDIFSGFDTLAEAQGLEKIKTIGDAYMVVGGLPTPRPDHAQAVAELALNMLSHVQQYSAGCKFPIQLRLGISSGPVIAGIIGRHRFSYDLWGDTVNTASRMESLSLPGRIQVSEGTHARLASRYRFEERGDIEVKGKGRLPTWFLVDRVPGESASPGARR